MLLSEIESGPYFRCPAIYSKVNILYRNKQKLYYQAMTVITHLRALQAIELALRKGSMKAAAEELSISPAAVGQRIRSLEDYLGFDLLVRGRSGLRPTAELEATLAHLNAAFRELETVYRLLDFQRVHEVHIAADSDWAELWLRPRLEDFRRNNPNTLLCINGTGDIPVRRSSQHGARPWDSLQESPTCTGGRIRKRRPGRLRCRFGEESDSRETVVAAVPDRRR
ncbi:MAG: LysR family transcriptional regulator [Gammaproteobacteria bacterium]